MKKLTSRVGKMMVPRKASSAGPTEEPNLPPENNLPVLLWGWGWRRL